MSSEWTPPSTRRRDRRALRPLWFSLPVVVLALVVAVYMLGMYLWSWSAGRSYQEGDLQEARESYLAQIPWGELGTEGWVAEYNAGTTLLAQGDLDAGVAHLRAAYADVPRATEVAPGRIETYSHECRVRMNLALGLEWQGDASMDAGERVEAEDLYASALETVTPCQSAEQSQSGDDEQSGEDSQSGGEEGTDPGEEADRTHDRIEDKQRDAEEDAGDPSTGASPSPTPSSSPEPDPSGTEGSDDSSPSPSASASPSASTGFEGETPEERQRREELERRQQEQQDSQDDQYDRDRSGNSGGGW